MLTIRTQAVVVKIGTVTLVVLPRDASAQLPSRGMTMVEGTINDYQFQAALEPDGRGSHWLIVDAAMRRATNAVAGDTVTLSIEPSVIWPDPEVPKDIRDALATDQQVQLLWLNITPMARWDWIRWIRATAQPETRAKRIEVACSKLRAGTRRPCCFNRTACTETNVSKNGVLLVPTI